jgi:hypothetical protein
VKALLERAGHFCFQGTLPGQPCALHHAVVGADVACMRMLMKFLRKYDSSAMGWGEDAASSTHFVTMLEWRDLFDNTPLALLCSLPLVVNPGIVSGLGSGTEGQSADRAVVESNRVEVLRLLIEAGAEVGAVNRNNQCTPLMSACRHGSLAMVKALLSVTRPHNQVPSVPHIENPYFPTSTTSERQRGVMRPAAATSASTSTSTSTVAQAAPLVIRLVVGTERAALGAADNSNETTAAPTSVPAASAPPASSSLPATSTPRAARVAVPSTRIVLKDRSLNPLTLLSCKPCDKVCETAFITNYKLAISQVKVT